MTVVFPPVAPSGTRTITPGGRVFEEIGAGDGNADRVRLSAALVGQTIQLQFLALSLADMNLIRTHWLAVGGTSGRWPLGTTAPGTASRSLPLTPAGYLWRYVGPPRTASRAGGGVPLVDVELAMVMIPPVALPSGSDLLIHVPAVTAAVEAVAPTILADLVVDVPAVEVATIAVTPLVTGF